jgi:hypothetical protein
MSAFSPKCPNCKYDLSASPDGVCPECGKGFTHHGLWTAYQHTKLSKGAIGGMVLSAATWGVAAVFNCGGACLLGGKESVIVATSTIAFVLEIALARAAGRVGGRDAAMAAGAPPLMHAAVGLISIASYQSVLLTATITPLVVLALFMIPRTIPGSTSLKARLGVTLSVSLVVSALAMLLFAQQPWHWWHSGPRLTPVTETFVSGGMLIIGGLAAWVVRKET